MVKRVRISFDTVIDESEFLDPDFTYLVGDLSLYLYGCDRIGNAVNWDIKEIPDGSGDSFESFRDL